MSFIKVTDGTNLFFKDWGKGKPVVFVHGWCIHSDSWEYIMIKMAEQGFRCIAYDQRGCGRSDHAWDGYDYDSLANDLSELINGLNLEDAVLVGHSCGCGVVTRYLANFGNVRVKKAIYISPTTPGLAKSDENPNGVSAEIVQDITSFARRDRQAYTHSLTADFFYLQKPGCTVSPALCTWGESITMQASARAAFELLKTMYTDQREELKNINTPVLVLHGTKDVTPPAEMSAIPTHQLLKNSELKLFPDQPHGMYIIASELLVPEMITFINRQ